MSTCKHDSGWYEASDVLEYCKDCDVSRIFIESERVASAARKHAVGIKQTCQRIVDNYDVYDLQTVDLMREIIRRVDKLLAELPEPVRTCRECGCTDDDCRACIERTGEPCHWVDDDLCSACAPDGDQP